MLHYVNFGDRGYKTHPVLPYKRKWAEFQLIASGDARPWYEELRMHVDFPPRPCLWLHAPNFAHGWTAESDAPSTVAVFHYATLPPVVEEALGVSPVWVCPVQAREARDIRKWAEEAKRWSVDPDPVPQLEIAGILLRLSMLALRNATLPAHPGRDSHALRRVGDACSLYLDRMSQNPSAESIAGDLGLSPAHLRRLFLQVKGRAPKAVYTELRMNIARRRLRLGEETVAELSEHLGFSEPGAFSRAYRAFFGHSPRQERPRLFDST